MSSLLLYTDVSLKDEWMSLGWIIYEVSDTFERKLVDLGSRAINTERHPREWTANLGEFRALISGVRAAMEYSESVILCCTDNGYVAHRADNREPITDDGYFHHALHSFLGRFNDWRVKEINRSDNELAHDMANLTRRAAEKEGSIV